MSRIGRKSIIIPIGTKISIENRIVTVSNNKYKLSKKIPIGVDFNFEKDNTILKVMAVEEMSKKVNISAMQGLTRSLINGMVDGINNGFVKNLEIVGVGFRAKINAEGVLEMLLGFSHKIFYRIPNSIEVTVDNNVKIKIEGYDKQLVGEVAATIRRFKKPDSYKGKGIRYSGEIIKLKEGKKTGK